MSDRLMLILSKTGLEQELLCQQAWEGVHLVHAAQDQKNH
jgi:hypothetical protein